MSQSKGRAALAAALAARRERFVACRWVCRARVTGSRKAAWIAEDAAIRAARVELEVAGAWV